MSIHLVHLGQNHAETEVYLGVMCLHSITDEFPILISVTEDYKFISHVLKLFVQKDMIPF